MRPIALMSVMALVVIASFLATLWLTDTDRPPGSPEERPATERLAEQKISSRTDLIEAAVASGLHASSGMKGNVDLLSRINDRDVTIAGWLADRHGDDTPLKLLVFVSGNMAGQTQTRGERPDVTKEIRLSSGAEKNVAFQVTIACGSGGQPIVVGVGANQDYLQLQSPTCP